MPLHWSVGFAYVKPSPIVVAQSQMADSHGRHLNYTITDTPDGYVIGGRAVFVASNSLPPLFPEMHTASQWCEIVEACAANHPATSVIYMNATMQFQVSFLTLPQAQSKQVVTAFSALMVAAGFWDTRIVSIYNASAGHYARRITLQVSFQAESHVLPAIISHCLGTMLLANGYKGVQINPLWSSTEDVANLGSHIIVPEEAVENRPRKSRVVRLVRHATSCLLDSCRVEPSNWK